LIQEDGRLNTHKDQAPLRAKALLAALPLLGLAACSSQPGKLAVRQAQPDVAVTAACENTKPDIRCALSPSVAFDQNGRLWAVWEQAGMVYVNHSGDFGKSFSPPVAVNTAAEPVEAGGEARPKIALSKIGAIYVAWTRRLGQSHTGQLRFSRSLDGGKTFTAPMQLPGEAGRGLESLAVNDRDYIYLAWIEKRELSGAALSFAYSSDGGRSFHPEQKIADAACECCRLAMKIEAKKFPVILWRQASDGLALARFTAKDKPGAILRASNDHWKAGACPSQGPALSITPQGDYYAAWFADGETRKGLFFSASEDQGKTFSPPLGFGRAPQAGQPDVLADGQSVRLAWKESDEKRTVLLAQQSGDGGQSWSTPKLLAETAGDSDRPFLLAYQSHHYVAWQTQAEGFRLLPLGD
jgi:hypothetical protein